MFKQKKKNPKKLIQIKKNQNKAELSLQKNIQQIKLLKLERVKKQQAVCQIFRGSRFETTADSIKLGKARCVCRTAAVHDLDVIFEILRSTAWYLFSKIFSQKTC